MAQHEQFNLDRHISEQHGVDPMGRKWEIHANRESSLVHARPNPDHPNASIPKEFDGKWTSTALLKEKIDVWIKQQWDKVDAANKPLSGKKVERITPEMSLAALPDEIKDFLGNTIGVEDGNEEKEPAAEAGKPVPAESNSDEELTGRTDDAGREEKEEEKEVKVTKKKVSKKKKT